MPVISLCMSILRHYAGRLLLSARVVRLAFFFLYLWMGCLPTVLFLFWLFSGCSPSVSGGLNPPLFLPSARGVRPAKDFWYFRRLPDGIWSDAAHTLLFTSRRCLGEPSFVLLLRNYPARILLCLSPPDSIWTFFAKNCPKICIFQKFSVSLHSKSHQSRT